MSNAAWVRKMEVPCSSGGLQSSEAPLCAWLSKPRAVRRSPRPAEGQNRSLILSGLRGALRSASSYYGTHEMVRAVEELRNDNPMWGKRKINVLLRREGSRSRSRRPDGHLVARVCVVAAIRQEGAHGLNLPVSKSTRGSIHTYVKSERSFTKSRAATI